MASGGGWGDPMDRDPELVHQDVRNGIYTVDYVRREFGVVINPETLDSRPRCHGIASRRYELDGTRYLCEQFA